MYSTTCPSINWTRAGLSFAGSANLQNGLVPHPVRILCDSDGMFLCRSNPAPPPHTGVIPRCRGDALAFFHMSVNCAPAKGCVWPVIAPAQAFVRAGAVLPGFAFLSQCFASVHARLCIPVAALCLGSRLSFFLCQEKRDGLRYLAFLFRRVEIAIRAFSWCRCGYLPWRVHFGLVRFFMAISTGYRDAGTELRGGTGSAARPLCVFARPHRH